LSKKNERIVEERIVERSTCFAHITSYDLKKKTKHFISSAVVHLKRTNAIVSHNHAIRTNEQTNERTNEQTKEEMNEQTKEQMNRRTRLSVTITQSEQTNKKTFYIL
jgi:hypothetical protein